MAILSKHVVCWGISQHNVGVSSPAVVVVMVSGLLPLKLAPLDLICGVLLHRLVWCFFLYVLPAEKLTVEGHSAVG